MYQCCIVKLVKQQQFLFIGLRSKVLGRWYFGTSPIRRFVQLVNDQLFAVFSCVTVFKLHHFDKIALSHKITTVDQTLMEANSFLICKHRWCIFVEIDFECSLQERKFEHSFDSADFHLTTILCVCDKKKVYTCIPK
ncbi:hypothetical protein T07_5553 [Trichinella nelsoni]|uniref:Uncharacterized protein n=1 Tax=Trichinella nelsoni TaxID=6336 RepID=A0A0V0RTL2_9BILA|nr:hypothetical protein T07_5553 [Trichinella nelsoni]